MGSELHPDQHLFESRVADVRPPKSDINLLILDYLTMEGYSNAAAHFSNEANMVPQQDVFDTIQTREKIKYHIHSGKIQDAIEAVNDLDPEILDSNPRLHFSLLRLQLIELIRDCTASPDGDIQPALDFATAQISPRASSNPEFLDDLEKTMALLVYPRESLDSHLAELLQPGLRREVAGQVNEAVLRRQCDRRDAAIRHLVRLRAWAESTAREQKLRIPDTLPVGLDDGHDQGGDSIDEMITTT